MLSWASLQTGIYPGKFGKVKLLTQAGESRHYLETRPRSGDIQSYFHDGCAQERSQITIMQATRDAYHKIADRIVHDHIIVENANLVIDANTATGLTDGVVQDWSSRLGVNSTEVESSQ